MGLVEKQAEFLDHVTKLLAKANKLGFVVTGGELHRTVEQQKLYIEQGRSQTMNSKHLMRLAIDLNFFKKKTDGGLELTYKVEELKPIGDYWESLHPNNNWGGNWNSFKDTPHFQRTP
jgi:hypothetical protein